MASPASDLARPGFEVSVDGSPLPLAAALRVSSLRVDIDAALPSTFWLEMPGGDDENETSWIDGSLFPIGGAIEIKLGYGDALERVLAGEITAIEPSYSRGARPQLSVRGYDRRHRLLRGRKTRTFVQQKDSDIASTLASEVGLTADTTDSQIVHDYVLQANQTDMEFLQERARRIQYELAIEDKTLRFRPVQNDQGEVLSLTLEESLLEFSPRLSALGQVSEIQVRGWSPKEKKELVGKARAGDEVSVMGGSDTGAAIGERAFGGTPAWVIAGVVSSQAEADQLARAHFNQAILGFILGEGSCTGRTDLRPGTVIELKGIGSRFSGRYYISATSHCYTPSDAYQTHFVAWRNAS
jgi:phage protein D